MNNPEQDKNIIRLRSKKKKDKIYYKQNKDNIWLKT